MELYRHADGGLYKKIGPQEMKDPSTGGWVSGVAYQNILGNKMFWTDDARWNSRFKPVGVDAVQVRDDTNELIAEYSFMIEDTGNVRSVLVMAADVAGKERLKPTEAVLRAQAEIISQGLFHSSPAGIPQIMEDVNSFHVKFDHGQLNYGIPKVLPRDLFSFREKFHQEETGEYSQIQPAIEEAMAKGDRDQVAELLALQLDALVDSVWVLLGTADVQFGKQRFYEAWKRVYEANMSKVRANRAEDGFTDSGRNKKFDIVKPAGWRAPHHLDLVKDFIRGGEAE